MLSPRQPAVRSRLLRLALSFFQSLSPEAALALGRAMGLLACFLLPGRGRVGLRNLRLALGAGPSERERRRILRRMWQNFGCNLAEFLRFPLYRPENIDRFVEWRGAERLERCLAARRGVLVLTAHVGNWDLLALATGMRHGRVGLVAKALSSPFWNGFLVAQRIEEFVTSYGKRNSLRDILRALRDNRVVGMVLDQDAREEDGRVFAPFFGLPASTLSAPAVLSRRLGLPVLPMFILRLRGGKHRILVLSPLEYEERETLEEGVAHNTACYLAVIERVIRRHPEQWNWIHRRWKRRPPGEPSIY